MDGSASAYGVKEKLKFMSQIYIEGVILASIAQARRWIQNLQLY
jgi:hypothetical protein